MSSEIDQRIVEMRFENGQFENGVQNSISTLEKLKSALKFDTRADGFDQIQKSADSLNFNKVETALDSIINRYSTLGIIGARVVEDLVDKAMAGIDTIVEKLKTGGMNRALNLEQAQFQLGGLGIEWDKSLQTGISKNVNDAVSGTAYGLDSAAKAASQLVASSVKVGDSMYEALRGIAGVTSMTQNSTYDDIANVFTRIAGNGKVMSTDLMSFSSRGLNAAAALGEVLGHTEAEIREMVHDGEINFEIFSSAMYKAFGEQAAKANETFQGAMSNVNAAISRIGAKFATPYIENIRPVLVEAISFINAINKSIEPLVQTVTNMMQTLSGKAVEALRSMTALLAINENENSHADNWIWVMSSGFSQIILSIESAIKMFGEFWSEAFPSISGNPLLDIANTFWEISSVLLYVFRGTIPEGSKAVEKFQSVMGDSSSIIEDFRATVSSIAHIVNTIYEKFLLVFHEILEPLAIRVIPAIFKYVRGLAEDAEKIVNLLLNNPFVDTAISGIGKGLTTIADLIFGIGRKSEDTAEIAKKSILGTTAIFSDAANVLMKKTDDVFSDTESILKNYGDFVEQYAGGVFGDDVEAASRLRRLGFSWEEIEKIKELAEEYKRVGESLFEGIDDRSQGRTPDEMMAERFNAIYAKNSKLIDELKQEAVDSVNSTFKHVDFDERSIQYMGDTFFNRFYDGLIDNGFYEKDALAIVNKFRQDFIEEYNAQSEEDWKAWQEVADEEATRHEELRKEHARDYATDRESMMGWTSSSVYSDMEKANKAFDKAWDRINSKNKGKAFDELNYGQMFNDFYDESYKALIDMGMSEEEAIRRSLINKQLYINKWAEIDEEGYLIMEANAEEYVKSFDEMSPIEKIGASVQFIVEKVTGIGKTIRDIAKSPLKTIWGFVKNIGSAIWTTVSSLGRIWDWAANIYKMFTESDAFKEASEKFGQIKDHLEKAGEAISNVFDPFISKIKGFKFPELNLDIVGRISTGLENITKFFNKGLSDILEKLGKAKEVLSGLVVYDEEGNVDIFGTLHNAVDAFVEFVGKKATEFKDWFKSFFILDENNNIDLWATIHDRAGQAISFVLEKIGELRDKIFVIDEETGEIDWFATFEEVGTKAVDAVQKKFEEFVGVIKGIPKSIDDFIGGLFGFDNGKEGIDPAEANNFTFFEDQAENLQGVFGQVQERLQKFVELLEGIPGKISGLATEFGVTGAFQAALSSMDSAISTAHTNLDNFLQFLTGLPAAFRKTFGGKNTYVPYANGFENSDGITKQKTIFEEAFEFIAEKADTAREALSNFTESLKGLFTADDEGELGIVKAIRKGIEDFIAFVVSIPGQIKDALDNVFGGAGTDEKIKKQSDAEKEEMSGLAGVFSVIAEKAGEAKDAIQKFVEQVENLFKLDENGELGLFKAIRDFPTMIAEAIRSITLFSNKNDPEVLKGWVAPDEYTLGGFFDDIAEKVRGVSEGIIGWFTNLKENVSEIPFVKDVLQKIEPAKEAISGWFDELASGDISIFDTILKTVDNIKTSIGEWFKDFSEGKIELPSFDDIKTTVESIGKTISGWFSELMGDVTEIPFIKAMIDGFEKAKEIFESIFGSIFGGDNGEVEGVTSEVATNTMYAQNRMQTGTFTATRKTTTTPEELKGWVGPFGATQPDPTIIDKLSGAFEVLGGVIGTIAGTLATVVDYLMKKIPEAVAAAEPVLTTIGTALAKLFEPVGQTIGDIFSSVYEAIKGFAEGEEAATEAGKSGGDLKGAADQVNENVDIMGVIIEHIAGFVKKVQEFLPEYETVKDVAWTVALVSLFTGLGEFFSGLGKLSSGSFGSGIIDKLFITFQSLGQNILQLGQGIFLIAAAVEGLANLGDPKRVDAIFDKVIYLLETIFGGIILFRITTSKTGTWIAQKFNFVDIFNNLGLMFLGIGAGIALLLNSILAIDKLKNADTVIDNGLNQIKKIMGALNDGVAGLMIGEAGVNMIGGAIAKHLFKVDNFKVGLEHVAGVIFALGAGVYALMAAIKLADGFTVEEFNNGIERVKEIVGAIALGVGELFVAEGLKDLFGGAASKLAGQNYSTGLGVIAATFIGLAASLWVVVDAVKDFGTMTPEQLEQGMEAAKKVINMIADKFKGIIIAVGGLNALGNAVGGALGGGSGEKGGLGGLVGKLSTFAGGLKGAAKTLGEKVLPNLSGLTAGGLAPGGIFAAAAALFGVVINDAKDGMEQFDQVMEENGLNGDEFSTDILTKIEELGQTVNVPNYEEIADAWLSGYYSHINTTGEVPTLAEYAETNPMIDSIEGVEQSVIDGWNQDILNYLASHEPDSTLIANANAAGTDIATEDRLAVQNEFDVAYNGAIHKGSLQTGEPTEVVVTELNAPVLSIGNVGSGVTEETKAAAAESGASAGLAVAESKIDGATSAYNNAIETGLEFNDSAITSKASSSASEVSGTVISKLSSEAPNAIAPGVSTSGSFIEGMYSKKGDAEAAAGEIGNSAWIALDSNNPKYAESGKMAALGFASGISLNTYVVIEAARSMAQAAINTANATLDNRSPSHILRESGAFGALGFVQGILDNIPAVRSATESIADTFLEGLNTAAMLTDQVLSDDFQLDPTIQPILDMREIQNGVAQIDGMFGQRSFEMAAHANVDFTNQQARMAEMMKPVDPINYSEQFRNLMGELHDYQEAILNRPTVLDTGVMVSQMRAGIDNSLGTMSMRRNRGL